MSEPIRYNIKPGEDGYEIVVSLGGEWVHYSDYARLKAEVERLTIQGGDSEPRFVLLSEYQHLKGLLAFATTKYCRLEAEVERLRKAGDAMERSLAFEYPDSPKVKDWNAAKEGKPSA